MTIYESEKIVAIIIMMKKYPGSIAIEIMYPRTMKKMKIMIIRKIDFSLLFLI